MQSHWLHIVMLQGVSTLGMMECQAGKGFTDELALEYIESSVFAVYIKNDVNVTTPTTLSREPHGLLSLGWNV